MCRTVGREYTSQPFAQQAHEQGVWAWTGLHRLIREDVLLRSDCPSVQRGRENAGAGGFYSVVFAVQGNQAGTISRKLATVPYFRRIEAGVALPTSSLLVKPWLPECGTRTSGRGNPPQRLPVSRGWVCRGHVLANYCRW